MPEFIQVLTDEQQRTLGDMIAAQLPPDARFFCGVIRPGTSPGAQVLSNINPDVLKDIFSIMAMRHDEAQSRLLPDQPSH